MSAETLDIIPHGFLVNPKDAETRIPLHDQTPLGRESGLNIDGISRKHCTIKFEDGFYICDSGSKYGTFINRKRIAPNQWRLVKPGDFIRLGGFELQLVSSTGSRATRVKAEPRHIVPVQADPDATDPAVAVEPEMKTAAEPVITSATPKSRLLAIMIDHALYALGCALWIFNMIPKSVDPTGWVTILMTMLVVTLGPMIVSGQSLGKMLMKIRVINQDGSDLEIAKVFLRELLLKHAHLFLAIPAFLVFGKWGVLFALAVAYPAYAVWKYTQSKQVIWDILGKTRVINA